MIRNFFNMLLTPLRAIPLSPRRLLALSLPARAAMLIAIFLVCCVATAYIAFYFSQNRTPWELWWRPGRIAILIALVIAIPIVAYQALRLWLEGEVSRFPDIDYAWQKGIAELARNGIDVQQVPMFLVVGSSGLAQEKSLFGATRLNFRVKEFPEGPAALHWYANPEAIYICTTDIGQLSKLAALGENVPLNSGPSSAPAPAAPAQGIRGTIMAGFEPAPPPAIMTSGVFTPPSAPAPAAGGDIRGTMMVGGGVDVGAMVAAMAKNAIVLEPHDALEQEHRLQYLCRLVKRARQPLCPLNGILTLLPYGLIQAGPREGIEVERVAKSDLSTIRHEFKLRCPATAMVVGLHRESGFRELVRRVGLDRAKNQRFGKGSGLWVPPITHQIEGVCVHACGAFEDWVYALFREADALAKPGNTKLYSLLCKIRQNLQPRLAGILSGSFAEDPTSRESGDGLLFGGCYFAAAGESDDRQAFAKGVLDKLLEQQEELEWTSDAIADDQRQRRIAMGLWGINAVLIMVLVGIVVYKMFGVR